VREAGFPPDRQAQPELTPSQQAKGLKAFLAGLGFAGGKR
jgi:hypothetical protein